MTGNYHEFSFGPAADAQGNLYIAHGLASGGGGAGYRYELRGQFNPTSSSGSKFACVPWRGWVCKIAPDGTMTPFASGLREPNGIGFDLKGNLWVADNQGDWVGTSKLHHIRAGHFYGHPSSLAWRDDLKLTEDPITLPVEKLDAMRTRAAVLLPHGILANSPTQPLCDDTGGQFGPFAGQLLIGEMNAPRLIRVMLDEVEGEYQGACTSFYEGAGLHMGNNRMAFAPDGSLWVGQTQRKGKWVGDSGMQRLTWTGVVPPAIKSIRLTPTGFNVQFTRPMQLKEATCSVRRFRYAYHAKYGSDQFDKASVNVTAMKLSADRLSASIALAELKPGFVHEITLEGATDDDGHLMLSPTLYYTLNRLRRP